MQRRRRRGIGGQNFSKSFTLVDKSRQASHGASCLSSEVNYNRGHGEEPPDPFPRRRNAIEAAVRADLAQNGFGDVAPSHSALLRNIGDDGARPSELAAHAGVTRQAITKLVDELERLDLVRRDPDPDDGRRVIVNTPTADAPALLSLASECSRSSAPTPRRSAPTAGPRCAQPSRPYSVTILTRT